MHSPSPACRVVHIKTPYFFKAKFNTMYDDDGLRERADVRESEARRRERDRAEALAEEAGLWGPLFNRVFSSQRYLSL